MWATIKMRRMLAGLLKSMRPHQWVKNAFVLAPLIFAEQLGEPAQIARAVTTTVLFCLLSGSVYLLNDAADVEKDRAHPTKRHRPIASGVVPVGVARRASAMFAIGALTGGFLLAPLAGACMATYFAMNLAYSQKLKNLPYVDVAIIALGFMLRVLAGAFGIDVEISSWLVICTFLIALFLGMGKRRHELLQAGDGATAQRKVLRFYSLGALTYGMVVAALSTVAAYTAYSVSDHATELFETDRMPWTIPFIVVGIARFFHLSGMADEDESPTERMIRDVPLVVTVVGWGALVIALIYFGVG